MQGFYKKNIVYACINVIFYSKNLRERNFFSTFAAVFSEISEVVLPILKKYKRYDYAFLSIKQRIRR